MTQACPWITALIKNNDSFMSQKQDDHINLSSAEKLIAFCPHPFGVASKERQGEASREGK